MQNQSKAQMEMSDATAVSLAKAGDCDAFRVLVERHSQKLFRLAFRLSGNEEDAEDIVQETFLRAYRNLNQFDERAVFTSWLYRIATNYAFDLLRMKKSHALQSLNAVPGNGQNIEDRMASEIPDPERMMYSAQLQERITQAMDQLSPQERVAFTLRHFEGSTIEEISMILHVGSNAAKHAVFRAVQKMRRVLQPLEGETAWRP